MGSIVRIIHRTQEVGFNAAWSIAARRIRDAWIRKKIRITKGNHFLSEMDGYWRSYKKIKKLYLNKLMAMKDCKGSGQFSNIVWWCWLQGEEKCPELQKICLNSVRRYLVDRKLIVITNDNLYDYVDFPDYIIEKYKKGYITNTHFSDMIRLQLLIKYGGTWIDSSVLCTGYDPILYDKPLFVYKNINYIWYASKKYCRDEVPLMADNWFITSEINNPILITVRDLLFDYWMSHDFIENYFVFHFFFSMVVNYKYKELYDNIPTISHLLPHMMQNVCFHRVSNETIEHIIAQSSLHKLTHKVDIDTIDKDCLYMDIIREKKVL